MSKRDKTRKAAGTSTEASESAPAALDPISTTNLSLHDLFAQQASAMLERADIDEEQKQAILVAMSCLCCGGGGMSFTVKLKGRR